jgi:hypothetical protein
MSVKGKGRASSLTGSMAGQSTADTTVTPSTTAIAPTVLQKNTYPKITEPDTFSGDRKKFKAYET